MNTTRTEEMNNEENLPNEVTVSSKPVKAKLEVKAKIELSEVEKKVLYWKSKGQSADWISKALQLHTNKVNEIINANL